MWGDSTKTILTAMTFHADHGVGRNRAARSERSTFTQVDRCTAGLRPGMYSGPRLEECRRDTLCMVDAALSRRSVAVASTIRTRFLALRLSKHPHSWCAHHRLQDGMARMSCIRLNRGPPAWPCQHSILPAYVKPLDENMRAAIEALTQPESPR
jgi:hypothetical protein